MVSRNRFLFVGLGAILVLWAVVYGVMRWAGSARPTPEKIERFVAEHPLDEVSDPERRKEIIGELAAMLNALEPEELREFERSDREALRGEWFAKLSPDEQMYFLERRIGRAFQQLMESFNKMEREERRKVVERSLRRMREEGGGPARLEETDPEIAEKITSAGLKSYYEDASAETKIDLAPLLEEMQRSLSMMRR